MFSNALEVEMHKKYDLRPRKKTVIQESRPQPNNISPSYLNDKAKETSHSPKVIEILEPSKKEK